MVNLSQRASSRVKSTLKSSQKVLKKYMYRTNLHCWCGPQLCPAMLRWIKMHRHDRNKKIHSLNLTPLNLASSQVKRPEWQCSVVGLLVFFPRCAWLHWSELSKASSKIIGKKNILQFCTVSPMTSMTFNQCRKTSTPRSPHRGAWSVSRFSRCLDVSSVSGVCSTMHQNSLHT